jgi:hypothetical protein
MMGGDKTITCEDGTTRICGAGTQECYDNSDYYCSAMMGGDKTITCEDGTTRTCGAGTQECYDNSHLYCDDFKHGLTGLNLTFMYQGFTCEWKVLDDEEQIAEFLEKCGPYKDNQDYL